MSISKGLQVRGYTVPEAELEWSFDTSGGPGGQHANRASSRARLSFDITASAAFPDAVAEVLLARSGARNGVVTIAVDDTRSQWRNRALARQRLASMLESALEPRQQRRPSSPSRSARRHRLDEKRRRAEIKRLRRRPARED
jgi:ribosome-associated protein